MGRGTRSRPSRLADKLLVIRTTLGLSQNEMIRRLDAADEITQDYVSAYERGVREPPLLVLLAYARVAGVCVDVLIDDDLDLPVKMPGKPHHSGVGGATAKPRSQTRSKSNDS